MLPYLKALQNRTLKRRGAAPIPGGCNPYMLTLGKNRLLTLQPPDTGLVGGPSFSPDPDVLFETSVTVTLSHTNGSATIYYTTNGTDPTSSSTEYTAPFTLTADSTLVKAIAYISGVATHVTSATYVKATVLSPVFNPDGGSFYGSVNVTITSATAGSSIRYTDDGSTPAGLPTPSGTLYSSPIALSATDTLKAIAYKAGNQNSAVITKTFTEAYRDIYYGYSTAETLDEAGVVGLQSYRVASSIAYDDYQFDLPAIPPAAEQYLYFVWRNALGSPAATDGFQSGGFPLGMATGGSYSNTQNGWSYATISLGGVTYRIYRTEFTQATDFTTQPVEIEV